MYATQTHHLTPPIPQRAGTYPFERPEDHLQPHAKLQRTINRIITVDYIMPASASPDAQDLLSKLLVGDPNARLNMEGVMRHAWFNVGLPAGVLEMNDALLEPRSLQVRWVDALCCPVLGCMAMCIIVWQSCCILCGYVHASCLYTHTHRRSRRYTESWQKPPRHLNPTRLCCCNSMHRTMF